MLRPSRPLGVRVRVGLRRTRRRTYRLLWALVPPARWFSPLRLVTWAMVLVVIATIWLSVYWSRRGGLAGRVVALRGEWTRELERGQFAEARARLEEASVALRHYGGKDRDIREVEQLGREVAIFADLLDRPLATLLSQLRTVSPSEVARYLESELKHPSMLLDCVISPAPTVGAGPGALRLDMMISIEGEAMRIDLSDQNLFAGLEVGRSRRVFFGARIRSIETSSSGWIVRLVPESSVLITSKLCLESLGWPLDEETLELLEAQARWVLDRTTDE